MSSGGVTAGSSRALRLDPFTLPARFSTSDARADERIRHVELYRDRIVLRRAVGGMRMAVNLPVSAYRGVSIHVLAPEGEAKAAVAVVLEHDDPSLALPLYVSEDGDELTSEWRAWSRVLGVPLLVADEKGTAQEPFARIGQIEIDDPMPRRRRRSALKRRRPSILLRRKPGRLDDNAPVHRDEREIIARN